SLLHHPGRHAVARRRNLEQQLRAERLLEGVRHAQLQRVAETQQACQAAVPGQEPAQSEDRDDLPLQIHRRRPDPVVVSPWNRIVAQPDGDVLMCTLDGSSRRRPMKSKPYPALLVALLTAAVGLQSLGATSARPGAQAAVAAGDQSGGDRKSTRLNSSHA